MTYTVSEDMRLGFGYRKTDEDMHEQHSRQIFFTGMPDPIADLCGGIVETIWSDSANTGRVSVEYDTSDDAMVYGSYSEGFRPSGVNRPRPSQAGLIPGGPTVFQSKFIIKLCQVCQPLLDNVQSK
mgnify:CR=1 FL=1